MDYVLIKRMVGRLKDVHVFKGVAVGMSITLAEAEVVVAKEWGNRVVGCRRVVVKVDLKKTEKTKNTVEFRLSGARYTGYPDSTALF